MTEISEPTVFLIDDDAAVLDSTMRLLNAEGLRTECFSSVDQFLSRVESSRIGCLVVDLRMPGKSGIDLLSALSISRTPRHAVVISGYAQIESVVQAMKLGAVDFLEKPFSPQKFITAVRAALELEIRQRGTEEHVCQHRRKIDALSKDEFTVLTGIVRGLTNQQLADELGVSLRTIQFRRTSLWRALGVTSKPELLALVSEARWTPGL